MGITQPFRGNPSLKQYLLTQNFIGGLNTKEADDVVTDIEFRELLNADLGNQGIITNRKGFKDLIVFNEMMEYAVDENDEATGFPSAVFRLAKVAKDSGNIIQEITKYESLQQFRTAFQSQSYELIILFLINYDFFSLTISKEAGKLVEKTVLKRLYEGIPVEFDLADLSTEELFGEGVYKITTTSAPPALRIGTNVITLPTPPQGTVLKEIKLKEIRYYGGPLSPEGSPPSETGSLKLSVRNPLTNQFEEVYFVNQTLPTDGRPGEPFPQVFKFSEELDPIYFSPFEISTSYLSGLEIEFEHANSYFGGVGFIKPHDLYFDFEVTYGPDFDENAEILKTYKSRISENNVEFLDALYILPDFESKFFEYKIEENTISEVAPYEPTPFDVKFVGFNVLADNPLTFIADQGISNKNIEGIFLTVDDNKPIQSMPGGIFEINVLHLGINFTTDEVGIRFFIDFETDDQQEIFPRLISAKDLGGLFIFKHNAVGLSNFAGREITIKLFELDKSLGSDITVNVGPSNYSVQNEETIIELESTTGFVNESNYSLTQESFYEVVKIKQVLSSTNLVIYGQLNGSYTLAKGARLITGQEKTSGLTFDPFVDSYNIISGFSVLPQPVEKLDLSGFKMIEIDYRMVFYGQKVIWFSDLYQFNYIPNYNFIVLPLGTTDSIQRIVFFRGSYVIFTKDEIYRMVGTFGTASFRIESVNKFVGCIAPNTVRNVGNELFFLTRDGLYKLKSSIFQDNLENVEKIDKAITDDVQISEFVDSLLYDEQYILYYNEGEKYDTLRMYYDIELGRSRNPFVRDIFTVKPELLVREEGRLFAVRNNRWYIYDEGYTDFMPHGTSDSSIYTYPCKIETASISFRYPTHQKKFKNVFIKALHGDKITPLFITVKVDGYDVLTPDNSFAFINEMSEVEYITNTEPNIILQSPAFLGQLELGETPLGDITQKLHKLSFGGKGKNIKVVIEQQLDASFGIISIGYLFKLGKVKE